MTKNQDFIKNLQSFIAAADSPDMAFMSSYLSDLAALDYFSFRTSEHPSCTPHMIGPIPFLRDILLP